jgi:hypothetical protein
VRAAVTAITAGRRQCFEKSMRYDSLAGISDRQTEEYL